MHSEDTKILELYQKSDKAAFIIYADYKSLIEENDVCKNNPENPLQQNLVNIFYQVIQCLQYCII